MNDQDKFAKWEYLFAPIYKADDACRKSEVERLNHYGSGGWEFVFVYDHAYIFKRRTS